MIAWLKYPVLMFILLLLFSCLKQMPDTFPSEIEWNPEFAFPVGDTSLGMNAASGFDTLLLQIDYLTGFPFWVDLYEIPIIIESSFSFTNIFGDVEQINSIMFRINGYNGFPAEVLLQIYFNTSGGYALDSMFHDGPLVLDPGRVKGSGEAITPFHASEDAYFSRDRIDNLDNAEEVSFRAIIQNVALDSVLIEYYPTYSIKIQIGTMVDLII